MNLKKVLSVVFSLVFLVALSASCKPNSENSSGSNASDASNSVKEEFDIKQLEGYEFTVATPWLRDVPPRDATTFERLWHQQKKKVEEKYKCTIKMEKFYPSMEGMIPKILAGDKVGDVVHMVADMWIPAVGAGYLRPWNDVFDIIDVSDGRFLIPEVPKVNDKYYVLGFERPSELGTVLWYNRDVLKKSGITEDPAQLVLDGKWTWEKFREMLLATTKDTDNDGKMNTYGIVSHSGFSDIAFALAKSNNSGILKMENKSFSKDYETPAFMEAINFYDSLINTDKVFKVYDNMKTQETWNSMPAGDTIIAEFRSGNYAFLSARMWIGNQILRPYMEADYGMTIFPKGPKADDYILDAQTLGGFALSSTNKDYRKSAFIFNELAHPAEGYEDAEVMNETIQNDFFQENDKLSFDVYKYATNKIKLDFGYGLPQTYSQINHAIVSSVFWRVDTPAASIEGLRGTSDEEMANTFKNLFN